MKSDNLNPRRKPAATFLALALSATLATYGCTTNRMPGDGEPSRSPNVGGAPSAIPGSSGGTTVGTTSGSGFTAVRHDSPRPMFSSSGARLTAEEAAAVMAQHQPARATYLGPSNPGPTVNNGVTPPTGQFTWPALQTNPQLTVNSTISSPATPAIVSGAGGGADASGIVAGGVAVGGFDADGGAAFLGGVTAAGAATTGTSAGVGIGTTTATTGTSAGVGIGTTTATAGTSGATAGTSGAVFSNNATALTPTTAAIPLTAGAFAAGPGVTGGTVGPLTGSSTGALTPTAASGNVLTPTTTLNPAFANQQQSNARLITPTPPTTGTGVVTGGTTGTSTASIGRGTRTESIARNTRNTRAATGGSAISSGTAATTRAGALRTNGTATGNVRVLNNNGRVVITNTNSGANQR